MATLTEKLQFLLTADASSAIKGFKSVEVSADRALAKTETGASKGMAAFQKYGAVAGGAGLVIGAAALKAAGAFEHLALAAGKMADSTGLSTEAASRWIEVAGDMGVETATVEAAVSKMDKALSTTPAKFEELGVAIAHTADGAVDVNGTFLNAIDVINGIKDPMKRAEVTAALFGKGWTSMSELIATGADNLKASLAGVDASKVFNDEEVGKAKDYREAMDNLKDKFEEFALKVGEELVPVLTDLADVLSTVSKVAGPAIGEAVKSLNALTGGKTDTWHRAGAAIMTLGGSEINRGLRNLASNLKDVSGEMAIPPERLRELKAAADELTPEMERAAIVTKAQGAAAVIAAQQSDTLGVAFGDVAVKAGNLVSSADAAATAIGRVETAWGALTSALDDRAAERALEESDARLAEMKKAATTGYVKTGRRDKKGKPIYRTTTRIPTAEEQRAIDAEGDSNIRQRLAIAEKAAKAEIDAYRPTALKNKTATANAQETTLRVRIQPYVDAGDEEEVKRRLDLIAKMRIVPFEAQLGDTRFAGGKVVDGGISDTAVAEALARAKKNGLIPS